MAVAPSLRTVALEATALLTTPHLNIALLTINHLTIARLTTTHLTTARHTTTHLTTVPWSSNAICALVVGAIPGAAKPRGPRHSVFLYTGKRRRSFASLLAALLAAAITAADERTGLPNRSQANRAHKAKKAQAQANPQKSTLQGSARVRVSAR
jgi:hypothetical protein